MKKWKKEEIHFLEEVAFGKHHFEIVELFNNKFGENISISQLRGVLKRYKIKTGFTGRFEKGRTPWNKETKGIMKYNKTSFKKGRLSHNYLPVGTRKLKSGYIFVKTGHPKEWKLEHRMIWEKRYGKVPKGCVLIFKDGNCLNTNLDNLMLISRRELAVMNHINLRADKNLESTETKVRIAQMLMAIKKAKKRIQAKRTWY